MKLRVGSADITKIEHAPRGVLKTCGQCGWQERMPLRPKTSRQTALWLAGYHDRSNWPEALKRLRGMPSGLCGSCGAPIVCTLYGYPESENS